MIVNADDAKTAQQLCEILPELFRRHSPIKPSSQLNLHARKDGKLNMTASSGKGRFFHGRPSTLVYAADGLENTVMLVEGSDSVA